MGMGWENRNGVGKTGMRVGKWEWGWYNGNGKMGMGWIRDGGIGNWEVTTSPSHIPISHIPTFPTFPGLQRILVPFSRIPPPPLEPNGFGSEAGTFRGTPPELRPYGNCREFQEFSWGRLGVPRPHPGFPNFS